MDKLKKSRSIHRTSFTKAYTAFQTKLALERPDETKLQVALNILAAKSTNLDEINLEIYNKMMDDNDAEEDITQELEVADEYKTKLETAKVKVARVLQAVPRNTAAQTNRNSTTPSDNGGVADAITENLKKFKLPKIELKKFNVDPKEWLQFWSIFKTIHDNASVSSEEKFQYLLQATVENSRASELVNSYPPTAANFTKVIESLKTRFGRDDLLVEVYVRELLKLVLNKSRGSLSSVYDKLETHLRALESLGVTTEM